MKDKLIGAMIGLARATYGNEYLITAQTNQALFDGLIAVESGDEDALSALVDRVENEKRKLIPLCYECAMPCGKNNAYDMKGFWNAEQEIRETKTRILQSLYTLAKQTGADDSELCRLICKGLYAIGEDEWDEELLLPVEQELVQAAAGV